MSALQFYHEEEAWDSAGHILKGVLKQFEIEVPNVSSWRLVRSEEQRTQFDAMNFFEVVGCSTGKRYRIHCGQAPNIQEIDDAGNVKIGGYLVPNDFLPAGDVMLAQKVALETNELAALAVANQFPLRSPPSLANAASARRHG